MITLKTLPDATAQQVFDQVVTHLRKQGQQSLGSDGDCAYRGRYGLMCAAGCLIADDEYDQHFDTAYDTTWDKHVERGNFPSDHRDLIKSLQVIHDDTEVSEWERDFKELAGYEGLVYKPTEGK